jgi:tetratricopeptide (TPR) repeat protein
MFNFYSNLERGFFMNRFNTYLASAGFPTPMTKAILCCGMGVVWVSGFAFALPLLILVLSLPLPAFAKDFKPSSDEQIIEKLPARASLRTNVEASATPQARVALAQEAIRLSRQTSDPRHLGRAQAALAPWWGKPDAPVAVAILQATIQQSRHEFSAARAVLEASLAREPNHAQGWLTLANLERIAGRYEESLRACSQVAKGGAAFYAQACHLETRSMLGEHALARRGLTALASQTADRDNQAWVLSLLAESEERAGEDELALKAYRHSLGLSPDTYTSLAMADLLLRTGRPMPVVALLRDLPNSDAVLIRRAYAYKLLGDPSWVALNLEISERFQALDRRGDDPATHARERALVALWLDGDVAKGLKWAKLNLEVQKEPADWLILASMNGGQSVAAKEIAQWKASLKTQGLVDARINRMMVSQ